MRGFIDKQVPKEVLERLLAAAAWSPSGSNLQPWHIFVLTGEPLARLKKLAVERVTVGDPWDEREYEMCPAGLKSPYRERRSAFGKERYSALGVAREDWEARQRAAIANWEPSAHPPRSFVTSTATLARLNGPMSACICRPSWCCFAPKVYPVAHRWRGRRCARRSRRSCHPRTG